MTVRFRAGKRLWESEDDEFLRRHYADTPTAALATRLRRGLSAVYGRAKKLGLEKSCGYLAANCRIQRGERIGSAFEFPKGHVPANKGLRRPGYARGRMKETQFKSGVQSGNTMPIGSTRLCDGYVLVKVAEVPKVPYFVNWFPLHVIEWERVNGPVPAGHVLAFRNGDKQDIRLDNLQLLSRRELMARNTIHNWPLALKQTVQLLGAVNRQITMKERRHANS